LRYTVWRVSTAPAGRPWAREPFSRSDFPRGIRSGRHRHHHERQGRQRRTSPGYRGLLVLTSFLARSPEVGRCGAHTSSSADVLGIGVSREEDERRPFREDTREKGRPAPPQGRGAQPRLDRRACGEAGRPSSRRSGRSAPRSQATGSAPAGLAVGRAGAARGPRRMPEIREHPRGDASRAASIAADRRADRPRRPGSGSPPSSARSAESVVRHDRSQSRVRPEGAGMERAQVRCSW